jgi:DNA primase
MRIPDEIIERVRQAVPIEDVVGEFVALKRGGANLKGLCPFHNEKTPSFSVHPGRQTWRCFGCNEGGNVFSFLMKINNMTFPEAVKHLAARAGIPIPESSERSPADLEREDLYKINDKALFIYNFYLLNKDEARVCREYLIERGFRTAEGKLDVAFIEQSGLGCAPDAWDTLCRDLKQSGFSEELGLKAGLLRKSSRGTCIDAFRNRLIIPIRDVSRHVIAFGGRLIPEPKPSFAEGLAARKTGQPAVPKKDEGPKYLNSPETPVFHKSEHIFGLDTARMTIREADEVIVVEGYFDALMLHYKGIRNAVAPLGTALTREQMSVMSRYSRNILLVFDSDAAGEKATWRAIELLLEGRFKVRILRLPFDKDPCDYVMAHGEEAFRSLAAAAPDIFTYMVHNLKERFDAGSMPGKLKILSYVFKYAARLDSEVDKDIVLSLLAKELDISRDALKIELGKYLAGETLSPRTSLPVRKAVAEASRAPADPRRTAFEREFVLLLLIHADQAERAAEVVGPDDFSDPVSRRIFEAVYASRKTGIVLSPDDFLSQSPDREAAAQLTDLLVSERFGTARTLAEQRRETEKLFADYLNRFHAAMMDKVIGHIKARMAESPDPGELSRLQADLATAVRTRNTLKGRT